MADSPLVFTEEGPSGTLYNVEIEVVWDDRKAQRIRVVIAIDDGGFLSSFVPMAEDFFVYPDGAEEDHC